MNIFIKRSRQFWLALTAKMTPDGHELAVRSLNETEQNLFYQMDIAIQQHCVNVANTMEKIIADQAKTAAPANQPGTDRELLLKAALLHDIGKISGQFTVLDRVWYVLVRKVSRRLAKKIAKRGKGVWPARMRNAFYVHVQHSKLGAELAAQNNLPKELVALIRHHHDSPLPTDSLELRLLRQADEMN